MAILRYFGPVNSPFPASHLDVVSTLPVLRSEEPRMFNLRRETLVENGQLPQLVGVQATYYIRKALALISLSSRHITAESVMPRSGGLDIRHAIGIEGCGYSKLH
jgi:hypothetical protein